MCAHVSEADPPPTDSWRPNLEFMSQNPQDRLSSEQGWHSSMINFASFGTPRGHCGTFDPGNCPANALLVAEQVRKTFSCSYST